jgi:hypothetical protein
MLRLARLLAPALLTVALALTPGCGGGSSSTAVDGGGGDSDVGGFDVPREDVLPGEPCTTDAECAARATDLGACESALCDPATSRCARVTRPDFAACDDGDPCTRATECQAGVCGGGRPLSCDDGNPCTDDRCGADGVCIHEALSEQACDDDDPCTAGDTCTAGVCAGAPTGECPCRATLDCDAYEDDRCDGLLVCGADGQCHTDPATRVRCETRADGPCGPTVCDPAAGVCVPSVAPDGTPCDDGNHCTRDDACRAGLCAGTNACAPCADDADCAPFDDGDACSGTLACTDGVCAVAKDTAVRCSQAGVSPCQVALCDPASGGCEVAARLDGVWCTDQDACTTPDRCDGGGCTPGSDRDCDDGDACTADSCAATDGCRHAPLSGGSCEDGDACTTGDSCDQGSCVAGAPTDCDDLDPCTADACDPATGCTHVRRTGDPLCTCTTAADCDDGEDCTTAVCEPSGTCRFTAAADDAACDDGDACTEGDVCTDGVCGGAPRTCDDGTLCTADSCDPLEGCQFEPIAGCRCGGDDDCAGGPCTRGVCDPATLRCDDEPLDPGVVCDDGNPCTEGTLCDGVGRCVGGQPPDCDDAVPCTIDFCDPSRGCRHDAAGCACEPGGPAGACDDRNECTTDACLAYACVHTALEDGTPCADDGDACTAEHTCRQGACAFARYTCPETRCRDDVDDDFDGRTDCLDEDCFADPGCHEQNCGDGLDSDTDGLTDCDDPDCAEAARCNPEADCADGVDDDEDALTDCADPDCAADVHCIPETACRDQVDNDLDGDTDCADGDCFAQPECQPERSCGDGIDEDLDGDTDCDDADCAADPRCRPEVDCADGVDQDLDGATDCDDPDCTPDPACTEQACLDGVDSDGDGATDCADPDCAARPECATCEPLQTVACGGTYTGSTATAQRKAVQYPGCTRGSLAFAGPEVALAFTPPVSGVATLTLEAQFNAAIVVLERACRPGTNCARIADQAHGLETLNVAVVGGTTYYVLVDGVGFGDQGAFALEVRCPQLVEDCGNGVDDDEDGLVDCDDPGCGTSPLCKELACADGIDNDGDGATDCADPDCAATFLCASCTIRQTLSCGSVVSDSTAGGGNLLDRYPTCTPTIYGGPEHVFVLTAPYDTTATFTLAPTGYDAALLVLEGECDVADACVARADAGFVGGVERQTLALRAGVTYYLVAEGFASFSAGPYTLSVVCSGAPEVCDNGVDDDGDGYGDCLDSDCEGRPCDDGDACTRGDICSLGACLAPFDVTCDDRNDCTTDSCDPAIGCVFAPVLAGSPCAAPFAGVCDDGGVCQQSAAPGAVVISEIMKDPNCVQDAVGEWFEVYNASGAAIDLYGWRIESAGDPGHRIDVPVPVPAFGLAVLCRRAEPGVNGGVTGCALGWGDAVALANDGADTLALRDPRGVTVDAVAFDDTFPDVTGAALSLDALLLDVEANDDADAWCPATAPMGSCAARDRGTPRAPNPLCAGDYCALGRTIGCGQVVTGDTSGLPNVLSGYACTGRPQTGGEQVFTFLSPDRERLVVELRPAAGVDLDLNVLRSSCDPQDCAGFGDGRVELTTYPNTPYHFVVDGYTGARGAFELTLTCLDASVENCGNQQDDDDDGLVDCEDPDCDEDPFCVEFCQPLPTPLACDTVVAGTTRGRSDSITTYACSGAVLNGGDVALSFVAPADGEVTFTLSYTAAAFLDLFVLEGTCADTTCLGDGDRSVTVSVRAGQTYYVVVDGRSGTVGDFALATDCAGGAVIETACDDGLDEDGDGAADCRDPDCRFHPYCRERTCDDGIDEDGDGRTDCADPDCAQDRACNACVDALPIDCDELQSSTTVGRRDRLRGYSCAAWDETGGERVFSFVATGNGAVTATLGNVVGGDLDVFVLGQACQPGACRAHGEDAATFQAVVGQTYFVVVDGAAGAAGTFDLSLACDLVPPEVCTGGVDEDQDGLVDCDDPDCVGRAGCAELVCDDGVDDEGDGLVDCADPDCQSSRHCNPCAQSVELVCGDLVLGTTEGSGDALSRYACADWDESGGEVTYRFRATQTVDVLVDLSSFDADLDVFVLDGSCDGASCITAGVQGAAFTAVAGRDYTVVVDGFEGAAGAYQLSVACAGVTEICGDGRDNDGDGDTDCDDSDCSGNPLCPEICDDGVDNDGDDRVDCADSDCDASPSCAELCTTDATVTCGQTYSGTTAGAPNEINTWQGCAILTATGGEAAHALTVPGPRTVTARLSTATQGLQLFATSQACSDRRCVAYDRGTRAVTFQAEPGESYWLVVDGILGAAGSYQLTITCVAETEGDCDDGVDEDDDGDTDCDDEDCAEDAACTALEDCTNGVDDDGDGHVDCADADCREVLACQEACTAAVVGGCDLVYPSGTLGATNQLSFHPACTGRDESGGELVYQLTVAAATTLVASLENVSLGDVDLFLLEDACDTTSCVAWGDQALTHALVPGTTYYVVVDGFEGDAAVFDLRLDCGGSGCFAAADCARAECADAPICLESACGDLVDNDGDGDTDCDDTDCTAEPACTCTPTGTVACGGTVSGNTGAGGAGRWDAYPACGPGWDAPGPEHVYTFTPTEAALVFVTSPAPDEVDFFVLEGACRAQSCLAAELDADTLAFDAAAGVTYYLVVDGAAAGGADYELTVDCLP